MHTAEPIIIPFLKWAGGKRWLIAQHLRLLPKDFRSYCEPFLGSGAVFFHLQPKVALLSDSNRELIETYQAIKSDWERIEASLRRHNQRHNKAYYYEERQRKHRAKHEKAAQFIYLNRTCWNGLYRVNMNGEFNVPKGTKKSVTLGTDNFEKISLLLKNVKLLASDFESVIDNCSEKDFLFVDPPYVTRHNFNGFIKYNDKIFDWDDQIRLAKSIKRAAGRGVKILVTNGNHQTIRNLYSNIKERITFEPLKRHSVLAADSNNRGAVTEIAITINYRP